MPKNGGASKMAGLKGITVRQMKFVQEYLASKDFDAKAAFIRAGYSPKAADRGAYRVLQKPAVQLAIKEAMERREARVSVTQDRVVEELARIAFLDPRDFYDEKGNLREITDLPERASAALRGMDVQITGAGEGAPPVTLKRIRMADKVKALELLARHLGMLNDRLNMALEGDVALRVDRIVERGNKRF